MGSNKDDEDDLVGFRDFIEGEANKPKIPKKRRNDKSGGFELLTFLEAESKRLEKHHKFYEEKLYMIKNFPQHKAINFQVENEIESQLDTLCKMLMKNDSPLYQSINEILRQFTIRK